MLWRGIAPPFGDRYRPIPVHHRPEAARRAASRGGDGGSCFSYWPRSSGIRTKFLLQRDKQSLSEEGNAPLVRVVARLDSKEVPALPVPCGLENTFSRQTRPSCCQASGVIFQFVQTDQRVVVSSRLVLPFTMHSSLRSPLPQSKYERDKISEALLNILPHGTIAPRVGQPRALISPSPAWVLPDERGADCVCFCPCRELLCSYPSPKTSSCLDT